MVVGENQRNTNIMDGIENTGDVRLHDHRLRLKQRFDIVRKLGQGTYGKVQLGINKKTGQEVAIKTIKKCKIESEADLVRIRREVQIMSSVRHPNIVHIYEVFENSEKMILVMEYCSGGELYDYLSLKKVLQEDEAKRLFRQIATAVYYCHIHKICHRDLKLENVLLDETGSAKIADFGLSNVFKETSLLSTFCGSPLYASPEIVKGTPYIGPEVDCWSLGVLLYTLVYGAMPFDGSNFKRLVRQISNGDYYEPKTPSTASPLIRDMLTVDAVKRADIAYICDHPWVNEGYSTSCLEMSEALAAETPVRLDLLLSLAPAAPGIGHSHSVVVPTDTELGTEESGTDLTTSTSMAVEPSNSAEKRILDLVAEGGEDAIKPSPTRTIVSAGDNKRKLELAMSASNLQRKKERVASCASIAPQAPVPEETTELPVDEATGGQTPPPTLKSSATITIQPSPASPPALAIARDLTREITPTPPAPEQPKEDDIKEKGAKPRVVKKKSPTKEQKSTDKDDVKSEEPKQSSVSSAADKLTSLSLAQPAPANHAPKPKKLSFPGGNVGNFKEQFERRASLTTGAPEVKRNISKPVISKIAKPKAQSEDRELTAKPTDSGTVRLQQIGIEPAPAPLEEHHRGGVKKTESEPSHSSASQDPSVLLQDARRSLQNSMAKLVEEKAAAGGEDHRRRAARDIISSAIRTGKPPMPYGRSSSAGVTSLVSPPGTPPPPPPTSAPRLFRTEAQHRVEDHRNTNRGVSVERIIPINLSPDEVPTSPQKAAPAPRPQPPPLRRLVSNESSASEACSSPGEPIKKSAREFIIPIAVEGKGYVTPRQRSVEPETATRFPRTTKPRRISSLVSGGESEEEDDMHMHRLRSSRAARAESVSSGEEDEEDEGFHLLTAENLFSTLLDRVRSLTHRLNGEEGPGFPQSRSLFNNLQSPFFNSPHLPRRNLFAHRYVESKRSVSETREGWGSRDLHADFESMFNKPRGSHGSLPRGSKKSKRDAQRSAERGLDLSDLDLSSIQFSEKEMRALSGLTPGLSRRLQRELLAHLPPAAARDLRRTLSLHAAPPPPPPPARSRSDTKHEQIDTQLPPTETDSTRCVPPPDQSRSADKHDQIATQIPQTANVETATDSARCVPPPEQGRFASEQERIATKLPPSSTINDIETATDSARGVPPLTLNRSASKQEQFVPELPSTATDTQNHMKIVTDFSEPKTVKTDKLNSKIVVPKTNVISVTHIGDKSDSQFKTDDTKFESRMNAAKAERACTTEPMRAQSVLNDLELPAPQFCTLPRLKRRATLSREATPISPSNDTSESKPGTAKEWNHSGGSSVRSTPDRPLLSKYLTPERNVSLDDSYSSDSASILSEPSYIAAYGPGFGCRRHSLRLSNDQPRKRISRFLRSDFFDTPPDESIYAKHKKEKELETQKILREIREKKNKCLDPGVKSSESVDAGKEEGYTRKCLSPNSPMGILTAKERSRSNTPFFPILDNIKETTLDTSFTNNCGRNGRTKENKDKSFDESSSSSDSKIIRPKSYPVKNLECFNGSTESSRPENIDNKENESKDRTLSRESKLIRPKSYPTSSPSPEKVFVSPVNIKHDETKNSNATEDIEVSFNVKLPKKSIKSIKYDTQKTIDPLDLKDEVKVESNTYIKAPQNNENLKKNQVVGNVSTEKTYSKEHKAENGSVANGVATSTTKITGNEESKSKTINQASKNEDMKLKTTETEASDKKGTIKKKIIRKVSSKSKTDAGSQESTDIKSPIEKKKVVKKLKEKTNEDGTKAVTKKKSVLQSIGQKLEKFASNKSNSPEKATENVGIELKKECTKPPRAQREQSVPVSAEPPTESNLIKRAVTLTDVAALEVQLNQPVPSKTTVSKVLGLFRKFDPKEKVPKPTVEQRPSVENTDSRVKAEPLYETVENIDTEKPKRPTSLLLNGLGRKNKYGRSGSDSMSAISLDEEQSVSKKDSNSRNLRNSLKLDFSRLPRVKKIVPTNPVIEPQIMKTGDDKDVRKDVLVKNGTVPDSGVALNVENTDTLSHSRSRSRSSFSNSEIKSDTSTEAKISDKKTLSPTENNIHHPLRNHESTTPEKEDVVDRIRRKSFYSRFNEKKHRRKSNLVGPGAAEYDPVARLHGPSEPKFDLSPTSPVSYDLSPGYSVTSDLSPSTERYRSLLTDLPRNNIRYDNYGLNDKIDTYRSLDRNEFRKYPGARNYLDYDQPSSYTSHRYSRTKSLLDSSDGIDDHSLSSMRDPHKYNRTISMYTPGSYATYRPKRTLNSAIILKENEKEPSPENILEKIRQRKRVSISVTRKPDQENDPRRSDGPSKSEGDGSECSEKVD